jgi:uncharacterized FAD-dependent dehydrogenase
LYPCGEGAGYAGGIISAAIDGEKCTDDWLFESIKKFIDNFNKLLEYPYS